jgi:acyl-CoA reductase-like NAD-dependent aldehyde dehydrogenase
VTAFATDLLLRQAFVDGCWVDADSGTTFPVFNRFTSEEEAIAIAYATPYGLKYWAIGGIE